MSEITREEMYNCIGRSDCRGVNCGPCEYANESTCPVMVRISALIESSGEKQEKPKVKMDRVQEIVEECERGNGVVLLKFLRSLGVEVSE